MSDFCKKDIVEFKQSLNTRLDEIHFILNELREILNGKSFIAGIDALCFMVGYLVRDNIKSDDAKNEFLSLILKGIEANVNISSNFKESEIIQ